MKTIRCIPAFVLAMALGVPAMAQTNMDILVQKVKADKKLLVAQNLQLTDAEGVKFWPVYEAYQKELTTINQRLAKAILSYAEAYDKGPIPNETAKKILDEALAVDDAEAKLKSATAPKILAVLPAVKAARYIQIESKIRAAVRYELAAGIPLVE